MHRRRLPQLRCMIKISTLYIQPLLFTQYFLGCLCAVAVGCDHDVDAWEWGVALMALHVVVLDASHVFVNTNDADAKNWRGYRIALLVEPYLNWRIGSP